MKIPYDQLSPDALQGLIEEFVGREGTDYGDQEYSMQDKVDQVRQQLERGKVVICYDSYLQSFTIVTEQAYRNNLALQQ
ncbi:MAG: YheU family protein [Halopseudomonas sp.]